jgi:hypothetical protein
MAKGDIISVTSRPLTDEEQDVVTKFEELETETLDNLEAGARQIISLVTAFYGLIFGAIALGQDKFEATLRLPWIVGFGSTAIVLLLLALGTALVVVIPQRYDYRESRLDDIKAAYRKMLARKSAWLRSSTILFGLGLATFAILIISMLTARL